MPFTVLNVEKFLKKQKGKYMKNKIGTLFVLLCTNILYANVNAVVSILPQKAFVEAIGGEKVNVTLMVKPGKSPHNYEPKASQMTEIEKADVYFTIGVELENVWLPKFTNQNKKMIIANMEKGIIKIEMEKHHHHDTHHDEHDKNEKRHAIKQNDPHIWTSPMNVKIIAKNIYNQLVNIDEKNRKYYTSNYAKFLANIQKTDQEITNILMHTQSEKKFMVFHPAWGYFARDYGLTQMPIEVSGKSPKPKQVMHLIKEAKEEKVKAVFTAPEFSEKVAQLIAKELGIPVIKVSPLAFEWSENLINMAKAIAYKR